MPVLSPIGTLYQCLPEGGQADVHPIPDGALVWEADAIVWAGPRADLPDRYAGLPAEDARDRIVLPGLVDCHTHLAFGGWRAAEFERRILGASYLEIARAGGGIRSTVAATRATPTDTLLERVLSHLEGMAALGVTTVEAKSGYGLDLEHELRLLEVYRAAAGRTPQRIVPTLLAAHAVPPEYAGRRAAYVDLVVEKMIPAAAARGLARFCDVFVEEGAFTTADGRRVLRAGQAAGLGAKIHADQLSACGGAELAAEVGAVSADHLERIRPAGVAALAASGVVAVTLPIAALYMGQAPAPARHLIDAGIPVAVATDFNPGSAPSYHLPFAMTLACTGQRMTPREVLRAVTSNAARALGIGSEVGSLAIGRRADFAVIAARSVEDWLYHLTANACVRTVAAGRDVGCRAPGR